MNETVSAPPRLDLATVADLQAALLARKGENVTVEMAQVTHLGALCLQVLIAAARAARASGHRLRIVNTSDRVLGQMNLMGMTPETIAEGHDGA